MHTRTEGGVSVAGVRLCLPIDLGGSGTAIGRKGNEEGGDLESAGVEEKTDRNYGRKDGSEYLRAVRLLGSSSPPEVVQLAGACLKNVCGL